jgi:hypothetical protein
MREIISAQAVNGQICCSRRDVRAPGAQCNQDIPAGLPFSQTADRMRSVARGRILLGRHNLGASFGSLIYTAKVKYAASCRFTILSQKCAMIIISLLFHISKMNIGKEESVLQMEAAICL